MRTSAGSTKTARERRAEGTRVGGRPSTERKHPPSLAKVEGAPWSHSNAVCLEDKVKRSREEPARWAGYHVENLIMKPRARTQIVITFQ